MAKHKAAQNKLRYNTAKQRELKKQAQKEIARIKHTISRAEKRGYSFNMGKSLELPSVLSSRTITRLKSLKGENLYKHATYKTPEGKKVSGKTGRKMERSEASRKGAATKRQNKEISAFYSHIVQDFRERMDNATYYWQYSDIKLNWDSFLNMLEESVGTENLASVIMALYDNNMVSDDDPSIFYDPDKVKNLQQKMLNYCHMKKWIDTPTFISMSATISNLDESFDDALNSDYYEDYMGSV